MAAEEAVIIGLASIFFGLAWTSFKLNESESDLSKYISMLFLALALGVLQVVGFVALAIADNNGMSYITTSLTTPIVWVLMISLFVYWASLLLRVLYYFVILLYHVIAKHFGGQID